MDAQAQNDTQNANNQVSVPSISKEGAPLETRTSPEPLVRPSTTEETEPQIKDELKEIIKVNETRASLDDTHEGLVEHAPSVTMPNLNGMTREDIIKEESEAKELAKGDKSLASTWFAVLRIKVLDRLLGLIK